MGFYDNDDEANGGIDPYSILSSQLKSLNCHHVLCLVNINFNIFILKSI